DDGTAMKRRVERYRSTSTAPKQSPTDERAHTRSSVPARFVPQSSDARRRATDRNNGRKERESRKGAHRQAPIEPFIRLAAPTHLASRAAPPVPRAIHRDDIALADENPTQKCAGDRHGAACGARKAGRPWTGSVWMHPWPRVWVSHWFKPYTDKSLSER
ncbi:hypothetical protein B0H13DRAFT_2121142, partial [Mycena leptocephala]